MQRFFFSQVYFEDAKAFKSILYGLKSADMLTNLQIINPYFDHKNANFNLSGIVNIVDNAPLTTFKLAVEHEKKSGIKVMVPTLSSLLESLRNKKLSYFYYYDVLEACARVLFQNDLEVTKAQAEEEGEAGSCDSQSKIQDLWEVLRDR